MNRFHVAIGVAGLMFVTAATALAGGWAVVTLDAVPVDPHAGTELHLGFMVRQHGVTPVNADSVVSATNIKTGETLFVKARQEGVTGHFVANVTFASAGVWEWEIIPAPFEGTKMAPLTVLAAGQVSQPAQPQAVQAGKAQPAPAIAGTALPAREGLSIAGVTVESPALRGAGAVLLLGAAGLALVGRRRKAVLARV